MIVYCCQDLLFATKIGSTAEHLGFASRPARDLDKLRARLNQVDDGKANGPVTLLLVDLAMASAANDVIRAAHEHRQTHPADDQNQTPAMKIVAFGSHVDAQSLRDAKAAGADQAMPRSQFVQQLVPLLEEANTTANAAASNAADQAPN